MRHRTGLRKFEHGGKSSNEKKRNLVGRVPMSIEKKKQKRLTNMKVTGPYDEMMLQENAITGKNMPSLGNHKKGNEEEIGRKDLPFLDSFNRTG